MFQQAKKLTPTIITILLWSFSNLCSANESGLLWKLVAPNGTTSYIFGAMHSDDPRITSFSSTISQAMQESETFMPEVLPDPQASLFMDKGTLDALLQPEEFDQLMQLADTYVLDRKEVAHTKPWLLAIELDQPKPASLFTQDIQLRALAQSTGKNIEALESSDRHFSMLDSLPMQDQVSMLRSVLNHRQEDKERDFEKLISLYLNSDLNQIAAFDETATSRLLSSVVWSKMRAKLLDERNAEMSLRIKTYCRDHKTFIAVGASHLAGRDGLLQRLRNAGFKVEPVRGELFT